MQCVNPIRIKVKGRESEYPDGLEVPCGKCLACRIAYRRQWSIRMLHELEAHDDAVFITLTYSDNYLPVNGTLIKYDLQCFFKRLRRQLEPRRIKYYAAGEYGDNSYRPHYHAIIFGLSLRPDDKRTVMRCWNKCDWSVPSIRSRAFGMVEPFSIQYVAQYIDKKLTGDLAHEEYTKKGRIPPFRLSSTGLGAQYCDTHADQLRQRGSMRHKGCDMSIPRYYLNRLNISTDDIRDKAIDRACEDVEHHCGIYIDADTLYRYGNPIDVRSYITGISQSRLQHQRNLAAKLALKKSKL